MENCGCSEKIIHKSKHLKCYEKKHCKSCKHYCEKKEYPVIFVVLDQMINLVKNECLGFDDEDRPMLDENTNEKIFEDAAAFKPRYLVHSNGKAFTECQEDEQEQVLRGRKICVNAEGYYYFLAE